MSKNPLQTCQIQLEPHEVGTAKTLDLGVGGRKVIYGQAVRPRIEVQSGQLEHTLDMHRGDVHAALLLSGSKGEETRFVTVGADRTICITSLHGKLERRLSGHRKRILGIWELSDNRLASWSQDKQLIVWSTGSTKPLLRIRARAKTFEHIVFVSTGEICITERWWQSRIVSLQGKTITVLKPQAEPLTGIRRLRSGAWITSAKAGQKLWNPLGQLLAPLPQFSFDDGFFEFPNGTLIVDDAHQISLLAAAGGRSAARAADEPMAKDLRAHFKLRAAAIKAISDKPVHSQFGFRDNPFSELPAPPTAAKKEAPGPESPWHFFHRPRHEAIQSWLQAEVKAANDAATRVANAIYEHKLTARRAEFRALLAWASLCPSTGVLIFASDTSLLWAALYAGVVSIALALWNKRLARRMVVAERALSLLPKHFQGFLAEVEAARSSMRAALPCVTTPDVYTGTTLRDRIDKTIREQLIAEAFTVCDLKPRDLITIEHRPIVLRDWSLLAVPDDPAQVTPNLRAFWWTPDGCFAVAVERIQVVLPTFDLLYVFSVDYDFAADSGYNVTQHVIYYRDVANVIIRDVKRTLALPVGSTTVAAKEMLVMLRSGEPVTIGALHETSAHALRQAALSAVGPSIIDRQRNLQTELQSCEPAHRARVQAELDALKAESLAGLPNDEGRKGVDEALSYIKQLVLWRKDPPMFPAPGVSPPRRDGRDREHPQA